MWLESPSGVVGRNTDRRYFGSRNNYNLARNSPIEPKKIVIERTVIEVQREQPGDNRGSWLRRLNGDGSKISRLLPLPKNHLKTKCPS